MRTANTVAVIVTTGLWISAGSLSAQDAKPERRKAAESDDRTALTLQNLFPKKGLFGPSPRGAAISHSGRFGAWLHRPHAERRHGDDLYLFDTESGETERITSAVVMSEFQARAREVVEHRKKEHAKLSDGETDNDGSWVGDTDADDEKGPRYGGVSGFTWAPQADELLFSAAGDAYRFTVANREITRLTKTDEAESSVDYLPDGSGYTYLRDNHLFRVRFGSHLLEQLDPKFEPGDELIGYEISPDGTRAAFVTRKGEGRRGTDRKVKIARYRDRFVDVREVPRHVPDDPIKPTSLKVWLYDLGGTIAENGPVHKLHAHELAGPRDRVTTPKWAPDSSRVAFALFSQKTRAVEILESRFPAPAPEDGQGEVATAASADGDERGGDGKNHEKDGEEDSTDEKPGRIREHPARVVHRFLHEGGPTTPRLIEPRYLADSHHLAFVSEATGFRHVHVLDPLYESLRQLTWGHYEVYPIDLTEDRKSMWVAATKEHPSRSDVYRLDLETGEMKRLTTAVGSYSDAAVSSDGKHALATFAAWGSPRELVHVQTHKQRQNKLTDSHPEVARHFTKPVPESFDFSNRHGHTIHGFLFKPDGWKKSDARPLLIYVYGGPLGTRKNVTQGNFHADAYFFAYYMAKRHGYVTCTIDPRGMSGYGAVFEKANFEQVGKPQVEDLVDGVRHLVANYGIDPERVGIHGWSFGGFQTQMCMYTEPDVFQVGIAGAGPTEWENYNSWYSTATIGESRVGKTDLEKYSLLPLAKNLEGKLLLVHGMEDANVLYQDTVRVYRELLKAGKETLVELFVDPTGGHGLGGDVQRVNRARKYEEFLVRTLGSAQPAPKDLLTDADATERGQRKPGRGAADKDR